LLAVLGPAEMLAAVAALGKFVPGVLAALGMPNEDRDNWRAHFYSVSTELAQNNSTKVGATLKPLIFKWF
jgi:hypothetical protein